MGLLERFRRGRSVADGAVPHGAAADGGASVLAELVAFVVANAGVASSPAEVDPDGNLFDYGYVDSVGLAAFLAFVEHRFGVVVSDEDIVMRLGTLHALARHIAAATASEPEPV